MKLARCLLLLLFAISASSTNAQDTAQQPDVRLGDSWTYNIVNDPYSKVSKPITMTVTELTESEITLSNGRRYSRTWDLIERPGAKYKSPWVNYKFPLAPGATWQFESVFPSARRDDPGEVTMKLDCTVIGWEEVTVPAGKYKALKIVRKGTWTREGRSGPVLETSWYVPDMRADAKSEYEDRQGDKIYGYSVRELVSFKPGPEKK